MGFDHPKNTFLILDSPRPSSITFTRYFTLTIDFSHESLTILTLDPPPQFIDELDKKFALTGAAPKVYPFDQLYLEQGGRQDIPRDQRYIIDNLYDAQPYSSLHQ